MVTRIEEDMDQILLEKVAKSVQYMSHINWLRALQEG